MLDAVKRYATKILLLHVALLALVVAIVLFAARQVYTSAREQAIEQNGQRLDLLADQTARGIENHYLSIMSDLDLIMRDESDPAATQPRLLSETQGRRFNLRRFSEARTVPVTAGLTGIMWRQLRGRVSQLFLVDNDTGRVMSAYPDSGDALVHQITRENLAWFKSLKEPAMSHPHRTEGESGAGYHLIAIPALGAAPPAGPPGGRDPSREPGAREPPPTPREPSVSPARTVVAVVSMDFVKERFFDALNEQGVVNAALLDDNGAVLVSIDPKLAGVNLLDLLQADLRDKLAPFVTGTNKGFVTVAEPYRLGTITVEPRILAFEPMQGLPGRRWTVLTTSPLSDSYVLVNNVFKGALAWAVFLTLSVTAVLVSTAFFMIRGRVKLERTRHELLTRELHQARQIQLAWLPDLKNVPAGLQVSAANLPASHISGDFYNWFALPAGETDGPHDVPEKIAIVIGDVTGHGIAAAFLMATAQLLVRTTLTRTHDPGRCLREVNRQLCTQGFRGQFITMVIIVLDAASSSIQMAIAGHPAPLVERAGKFLPLVMEPQLVLGVDPQEHYITQGFLLEPGASVLLYTDGVVEAEAATGKQYGVNNLIAAIHAQEEPERIIQNVLDDVKRFCQDQELHDDVTLVALRCGAAVAGVHVAPIAVQDQPA